MSITLNPKAQSIVATGGQQINVASLVNVTPSSSNPTYLVVSLLDRDEYTASSNGQTGTLLDNGHTIGFSDSIGGDSDTIGIVFTYNAATGQYTNSTYGSLSNLVYTASTNTNDNTSISFFTSNNSYIANAYANNPYDLQQYSSVSYGSYTSYVGSVSVVTQPSFADVAASQATPDSVEAAALSFVGKTWNDEGCWVLASNISAEAGASLPITSTELSVPGVANGEWIVAYNGPAGQTGNWQSQITAGEMVVFETSSGSGHITTVVSGSGSTAEVVDNAVLGNNSAKDGSASDIIIAAPHPASQEWAQAVAGSVVVYELDCPVITVNTPVSTLASGKTESVSSLFTAANPVASQAITEYQFYDTGTNSATGSFVIGSADDVATSAASAITVSASSLSSVALLAGNSAGTDTVEVRAYNGSYWGDWQSLTVNVVGNTVAPTVSSVAASGSGTGTGTGDLDAGHVVTFTVNLSEAVTVAGGTPTLTLNDGGVATYTGGSGTNALTFSYTVASGQNTAALAITGVNLNSASVTDGAGNAASLSGAATTFSGLAIDTATPTVSSVAAAGSGITSGAGDLDAGHAVTFTVNLSEAVTVAGGTPTLTLNDGGVATYTGGSGTNALTFSYTVAADRTPRRWRSPASISTRRA